MESALSATLITVKNLTPEEKVKLAREIYGVELYHCTACEKMYQERDVEYDNCSNCDILICKNCSAMGRMNGCSECTRFFCLKCSEIEMTDDGICIDCEEMESEDDE